VGSSAESRDVVNWNIVPWYLGDENKIGNVRTSGLDEARPALLELLSLLPDLRVVVLCGRKAQEGWERARLSLSMAVLRVPHPSGRLTQRASGGPREDRRRTS
jgi:predicted ATP-dependent serine protease